VKAVLGPLGQEELWEGGAGHREHHPDRGPQRPTETDIEDDEGTVETGENIIEDTWEETETTWTRHHRIARMTLFDPRSGLGGPYVSEFGPERTTSGRYGRGGAQQK